MKQIVHFDPSERIFLSYIKHDTKQNFPFQICLNNYLKQNGKNTMFKVYSSLQFQGLQF